MEAVKAFHRMLQMKTKCVSGTKICLYNKLVAEVHIVLMLINTLGNEPNFISAKSTSIRYYEKMYVTLNYSSCNVNTSISIYFIPMVLMERL